MIIGIFAVWIVSFLILLFIASLTDELKCFNEPEFGLLIFSLSPLIVVIGLPCYLVVKLGTYIRKRYITKEFKK